MLQRKVEDKPSLFYVSVSLGWTVLLLGQS